VAETDGLVENGIGVVSATVGAGEAMGVDEKPSGWHPAVTITLATKRNGIGVGT
jgi:hypothetical protein